MALAEGNVLAVDFLVRNGCSPQQKLQSFAPLHVAAQMNDEQCMRVVGAVATSPSPSSNRD